MNLQNIILIISITGYIASLIHAFLNLKYSKNKLKYFGVFAYLLEGIFLILAYIYKNNDLLCGVFVYLALFSYAISVFIIMKQN